MNQMPDSLYKRQQVVPQAVLDLWSFVYAFSWPRASLINDGNNLTWDQQQRKQQRGGFQGDKNEARHIIGIW